MKLRKNMSYLLSLFIAVAAAFILGGVIMALSGHDPIEGYTLMFQGAFGTQRASANTLAKASTLCLCGLATAIAAHAGIFNVGGEGQLYLGAMASAWVGARLTAFSRLYNKEASVCAGMENIKSRLRLSMPAVRTAFAAFSASSAV